MADKPERCDTCRRPVKPAEWDDHGYECSHVACPHREHLTAAPPIDTDGRTPARRSHE